MHDLRVTGAQTGAREQKSLQIAIFVTVSKAVRGHWPLEGSNPSPSAQPSHFGSGARFSAGACGLSNRSAQSMEARGRLQESTGFTRHWRTSGAPSRRVSFSTKTTRRHRVPLAKRRSMSLAEAALSHVTDSSPSLETRDPSLRGKTVNDARPPAGTRGHAPAGNRAVDQLTTGRACPLVVKPTYPFCTRAGSSCGGAHGLECRSALCHRVGPPPPARNSS